MKYIKKQQSLFAFFLLFFLSFHFSLFSQDKSPVDSLAQPKISIWKKVQFGGGLGLNFGTGFTDISISPVAIYPVNDYFSVGAGLFGSYVSVKKDYHSFIYGGNLITILNPFEELQLSLELEQLRVNTSFDASLKIPSKRFWNTGFFIGAGYRNENVTFGIRYNVLFNKNDGIYNTALMPFVRVLF